jgi:hypothetical protein
MSKLTRNITDTARIFRGDSFTSKFSDSNETICLSTPYLVFELHKREPKGRFFADKNMIAMAGGPWFIRDFKKSLEVNLLKLNGLHMKVSFENIESFDLFSYQTCGLFLSLNSQHNRNTTALQIVQKAMLFAIVDEILESKIKAII